MTMAPDFSTVEVDRFWAPLGHEVQTDAGGFLRSPGFDLDALGVLPDDALVPTKALVDVRGLILLGPPGSGKSVELDRLRATEDPRNPSLYVELGAIADMDDLRRQVFDQPAFVAWRRDEADLTLFLDSIDEGLLSIDNIGAVLRAHLDGPGHRFHIRITCRPADWPEGLGQHLSSLLGEDSLRTLSLAPLRAVDAKAIARAALGDRVESFFEAIYRADVRALTALPLSLRLLLRVFRSRGALPEQPADLFEQATYHLCDELNLDRRDAKRTGAVDPSARHGLATRIAGLLRLSGKTRLNLGPAALTPPDALAPESLQPPPNTPVPPFSTDRAAVQDLVRHAALFEPAGDLGYRPAHAALGEFLAARFLHTQGTPPDAALALLSHPDGGLLPQHRQTAGWLAALDSGFFEALAQAEPDTALLYVHSPPEGERAMLLDALLAACDRGALNTYDLDSRRLALLDHPGVTEQLLLVIGDPTRSEEARRLALYAAIDLSCQGLVPDALSEALNAAAPVRVRRLASRVVAELGEESDRLALLPLARIDRREDPGRDVAFEVRRVLFPEILSVRDLIEMARDDAAADERARQDGGHPRPAPAETGALVSVSGNAHSQQLHDLLSRVAAGLPVAVLRDALLELASVPKPDPFEHRAATALAEGAAERLPDDALATALAQLLLGHESIETPLRQRLPRVVSGVHRAAAEDELKRRSLLTAIVQGVAAEVERGVHAEHEFSLRERLSLLTSDRRLIAYDTAEVKWMLDKLRSERVPAVRQVWAALVMDTATYSNRELWEPVLTACLSDDWTPELLGIYLDRFAAHDVHGPDADAARERQRRWDGIADARDSERIPHVPPLGDQVDALLSANSPDPAETWGHLLDLLDLDPEDTRFRSHHWNLNPMGSALWKKLTDAQHAGIAAIAERVLRSVQIPLDEALEIEGRLFTRTRNVLEAVALLAQTGTFDTDAIPDDAIVGLAISHLAHYDSSVNEVSRARDALRDAAWNRCLDGFVDAVVAVARQPEHAYTLLGHLLPVWDERFVAPFVEAARALAVGPWPSPVSSGREHMLDRLMANGVSEAVDVVLEEVAPLADPSTPIPRIDNESKSEAEARLRWRSTAVFLVAPEKTWTLLVSRFESDDEFARDWLRSLAGRIHDGRGNWPGMTAALTAQIYRRLHDLLPPSDDIQRPSGTSYTPTAQDNIYDLRWILVGALTSRATAEDVAEVRRLHADFPDAGLLRAAANVERQHRRLYPSYPAPEEVLRLASNPARRPIRSDAELQRAVVHALGIVQEQIAHAQQRAAAIFWTPMGKGTKADGLSPRDENYVSDQIARLLRSTLEPQGVLVTRESEANRGDRTDLLVQAPPSLAQGRTALASVVIEVKGSWHDEVPTAQREQLAVRYLSGSGRLHGVYLVVWFDPKHWSSEDARRKGQSAKYSADELRKILAAQAAELATDGYVVSPVVIEVPASW